MIRSICTPASHLAAALAFLLILATPAAAQPGQASNPQEALPPVTRTYAIVNARIVQAPGREIPRGTVLVRDGLIAAVGANVAVPFDAERIPGDSLVVYAGFIDGLSNAGIPQPKREDNSGPVSRANPPDDKAGIQPERFAHAMIDPADKSIADLRNAGFTAAHVVPHGNMLPGSGAVILLAGASAREMVLVPDASMFFQFDGARRMYPATPMGVMAKFRQLYREAERRKQIETLYAANSRGIARPEYDPVHYAFFPVIDRDKPVFVYADNALEIYRAFRLQEALGFPLILGGIYQAFDAMDQLAAHNVPMFLTLKLPKEDDKKGKGDSVSVAGFDPAFRAAGYADVEKETKNLEARQEIFRRQYIRAAADLHDAGLVFGFSTKDVKPADIHKNLRKMVAAGLPEETALAALTTDAARMLDLSDNLGTVETGKIANLVVADGPLFAEKTALELVFVDGVKYKVEAPRAEANGRRGGSERPSAVGSWRFVAESANLRGVIAITGTADNLEGTIEAEGLTLRTLQNVTLDGETLRFEFSLEDMGALKAVLTIDGDALDGAFESETAGSMPVTATRQAPGRQG
ncbi:MAG: amidohydrolase family protein [Rhodothermales bacterium]